MPIRATRSGAARVIRSPAKRTSPDIVTSPEIARSVVVLPAPFAAEDGHDLALADRERDAVERLHRAVASLDVLELEERRHQSATPR